MYMDIYIYIFIYAYIYGTSNTASGPCFQVKDLETCFLPLPQGYPS